MKGKFLVLKSSAGSGKTYALVRNYLELALSTSEAFYYSHILAITFTNAAAAEMKERIVSRLREFSIDVAPRERSELFQEISQRLKIDPMELKVRAEKTLNHILHNYSRFGVMTIDSFTHRIIRSFARDLRLSPDFNVEMDLESFAEKMVDSCLSQVGKDADLTKYLEEYVLDQLEEEGNWNIRPGLIEFSKALLKEDAHSALIAIQHMSPVQISESRKMLFTSYRNQEKTLIELSKKALALFEKYDIQASDLYQGNRGPYSMFQRMASGDKFELSGYLEKAITNSWASGKTEKKSEIESISAELNTIGVTLMELLSGENYKKWILTEKVLTHIYSMGISSRLAQMAKEISQNENVLLISDFHKMISDIIAESPAPFIYERVGERYNHILIDEFQDTSALQWQNFIPLVENALSHDKLNLIVGDGKQAIYRWRSGAVQQFVQLPQLPSAPFSEERKFLFEAAYQAQVLEKNFRSAKSIVNFNNSLYAHLSNQHPITQKVFKDQDQISTIEREGLVKINFIEKEKFTNKEEKREEKMRIRERLFQQVLQSIQESINSGYEFGDIAILTRKGAKEGGLIGNMLSENGIRSITPDSFLLSQSQNVRWTMAILAYLSDKRNSHYRFEIIRLASEVYPEQFSFENLTEKYSIHRGKEVHLYTERFIDDHFKALNQLDIVQENVYGIAEKIVALCDIPMDQYVEFLLDKLLYQSIDKEMTLSEIVTWWEEKKDKLSMVSVADSGAVQIMTIHKSKGLQFPVVIYPRFAGPEHGSKIWVRINEEEYGIPYIYTSTSTTLAENEIATEFIEEESGKRLDDLNLCYVATTRAEQRLYMIIEDGSMNTLSKSIVSFLPSLSRTNSTEWIFGKEEAAPLKKNISQLQKEEIQLSKVQDKGTLKLRLRPYREEGYRAQQIESGEIIHECLSMIEDHRQVEEALEKIIFKNNHISASDRVLLRKKIVDIIMDSDFSSWFLPGKKILNERDIYLPNGHVLRPDRVILEDDQVTVIDFKTGHRAARHAEQVESYMKVLSLIFQKPVRGYIAYTGAIQKEEVFLRS